MPPTSTLIRLSNSNRSNSRKAANKVITLSKITSIPSKLLNIKRKAPFLTKINNRSSSSRRTLKPKARSRINRIVKTLLARINLMKDKRSLMKHTSKLV